VLLRHQAGARHSQSPIEADGGAVIELVYRDGTQVAGQYCSVMPFINPSVVLPLGRSDDFARQAAQLKGLDGDTEVQKNRGANVKTIVEQITKDGSPAGLTRAVNFFNWPQYWNNPAFPDLSASTWIAAASDRARCAEP